MNQSKKEALIRTLREGAAALERATSTDDVEFVVSTISEALTSNHVDTQTLLHNATRRLERLKSRSSIIPCPLRTR